MGIVVGLIRKIIKDDGTGQHILFAWRSVQDFRTLKVQKRRELQIEFVGRLQVLALESLDIAAVWLQCCLS